MNCELVPHILGCELAVNQLHYHIFILKYILIILIGTSGLCYNPLIHDCVTPCRYRVGYWL